MRKVVKIIITERGGIQNVGVALKGITDNRDVVTAAIGLVKSISPGLMVRPIDVTERMAAYFKEEEAADDRRRLSGGAGAVSQEGEEEKRNPGGRC